MTNKPVPKEPELIACEICLKEIPASASQSAEAHDYVHHFCGIDCYQQWQQQQAQDQED